MIENDECGSNANKKARKVGKRERQREIEKQRERERERESIFVSI